MIHALLLAAALTRPATTNCQTVTFAFDSGNGANVPVTICGGIAPANGGHWIFYVDGENTITVTSPPELIFGHDEQPGVSTQPLQPGPGTIPANCCIYQRH